MMKVVLIGGKSESVGEWKICYIPNVISVFCSITLYRTTAFFSLAWANVFHCEEQKWKFQTNILITIPWLKETFSSKFFSHIQIEGCQADLFLYLISFCIDNRFNCQLNVEKNEDSYKKKFFWVTRYSLGRTFSKELLIEHEFANDQTRHRLIELHTYRENEQKHQLLLAIIALILNPPIGLIACILMYMAKRKSKYLLMNYENIAYERSAARYAFISYLFSLISIGLTIGAITAVLLDFFVQDFKIVNQNSLNTNRNDDRTSSDYIHPDDNEYQQEESRTFDDDGGDEQ